nr:GIY-YIG nuclease family protein [Algoriphagus aestuariicola]
MYILICANGQYYTGSTKDLDRRLTQHQEGEGANFTKKHLPVVLVYFEKFSRIDEAFFREKQVQNWSHAKKDALINGDFDLLSKLSKSKNSFTGGRAYLGQLVELGRVSLSNSGG